MRPGYNTKWLAILIIILGVAVFWGWQQAPAEHDHQGHDHDQCAEEAHQKAPVPGQVKLTPEAVKQAGIETGPVVLVPLDDRVQLTGELAFNEERLARIRSRVPGRVVGSWRTMGRR